MDRNTTSSTILVPFLLIFSYVASFSFASVMLELVGYLLGIFLCFILYKGKMQNSAIRAFSIVFSIYVFWTVFRYIDIDLHWNVFMQGRDEKMFWETSNEGCGKDLSYLIQHELFERSGLQEQAYVFYIKTLAMIASNFFDGNHVLYQLLGTSILGTYISIFMAGMIDTISPNASLYKKNLAFMCLSCLLPVSLIIHRDVMLMLLYVIAMYLSICHKLSIKIVILQLILAFVAFYVREQNGLFMALIIIAGLFGHASKYYKVAIIILGVITLVVVLPYLAYVFELWETTQEAYTEFGIQEATGGLSSIADRLPFPIKECALVFQGQFQPLPIWAELAKANTFYYVCLGILWMFISVYWLRVVAIGFCYVIPNYKNINKTLFYLWIVYVIYIFMSAVNADPRRLMAMYAAPYLLFLCVKDNIRKDDLRKFDRIYYAAVVAFMIVIFILKGGFK